MRADLEGFLDTALHSVATASSRSDERLRILRRAWLVDAADTVARRAYQEAMVRAGRAVWLMEGPRGILLGIHTNRDAWDAAETARGEGVTGIPLERVNFQELNTPVIGDFVARVDESGEAVDAKMGWSCAENPPHRGMLHFESMDRSQRLERIGKPPGVFIGYGRTVADAREAAHALRRDTYSLSPGFALELHFKAAFWGTRRNCPKNGPGHLVFSATIRVP